jgi:hypothetical protein
MSIKGARIGLEKMREKKGKGKFTLTLQKTSPKAGRIEVCQ